MLTHQKALHNDVFIGFIRECVLHVNSIIYDCHMNAV